MDFDISTHRGEFPINVDPAFIQKSKRSKAAPDVVLALRYGFRPDSMDKANLKLSKDKDDYLLESEGPGENHVFRGNMTATKDVECILVWDPVSKSFQLTPLDYNLRVNPSREKPGKAKEGLSRNASPSPRPATPVAQATKKAPTKASNLSNATNAITAPVKSSVKATVTSAPTTAAATATKPSTVSSTPNGANAKSKKAKPASVALPSKVAKLAKPSKTASNASVPASNSIFSAPVTPLTSSVSSPSPKVSPRKPTASKSLPKKSPAVTPAKPAKKKILSEELVDSADEAEDEDVIMRDADDISDDDLLGALANELEESLEDDSNDSNGKNENNNSSSEESDEDDDNVATNRVSIIDRSLNEPSPILSGLSSPAIGSQQYNSGARSLSGGPISLRGFASGTRQEEEELSSSEEE